VTIYIVKLLNDLITKISKRFYFWISDDIKVRIPKSYIFSHYFSRIFSNVLYFVSLIFPCGSQPSCPCRIMYFVVSRFLLSPYCILLSEHAFYLVVVILVALPSFPTTRFSGFSPLSPFSPHAQDVAR